MQSAISVLHLRLCLLAGLLAFFFYQVSAKSFHTEAKNDEIIPAPAFTVYRNPGKEYKIEQINALVLSKKLLPDPGKHNEDPNTTYWIRFQLPIGLDSGEQYFLEYDALHSDTVICYVEEQGQFRAIKNGEGRDFLTRPVKVKNLLFPLPHASDGIPPVVYLKVRSGGYSHFSFKIRSATKLLEYYTLEYYLLGLFYGILLILALYNLMLFFAIKDVAYLYYILYVAMAGLSTMAEDGLGFQFIWHSWPQLSRPLAYYILPISLQGTFLLYASSIMNLRTKHRGMFRLLAYGTCAYLLYFFASLILIGSSSPLAYLFPYLIVLLIALKLSMEKSAPARLFLLGYIAIMLGYAILQLRAAHLISDSIFTVYAVYLAYVLEAMIFSYSLSFRFSTLKAEAQRAQLELIGQLEENKTLQEKVNLELNEKVKERTNELERSNADLFAANEKLAALNAKVNEINSKLDYDNYYLRKDFEQASTARILDAELNYKEFSSIYPDDRSCLQYLANLKWNEKFHCRKCANQKSSSSVDGVGRKCSRCGHLESAIAYTLFHGLKFPLQKAFFIAYHVHRSKKSASAADLARMLDLRSNTCWGFKKKVDEQMQAIAQDPLHKGNVRWEELLLTK